jgi:ribosomal protein L37E
MSAIYCSECGKKHEYNLAKPNFCSSCGTPFSPVKKKMKEKEEEMDDDDEEEDDEEDDDEDDGESYSNSRSVPSIRKFQVDIEASSQYNTFSLGSILGSEANPAPKTAASSRRKGAKTLEDFKQSKK